jgi:hypothetical protein
MNRKVIYIASSHLCEKTERDWYINYLRAKNIIVEYWDILSLLFGEIDEFGSKSADYLRTPQTYDALETMLRMPENKGAYYVMPVNYEGRTVKLYRLLSKYNARMLFIAWAAFPGERSGRWSQVLHGVFTNPLKLVGKVLNKIKAAACRKLKIVKPFEIVFAAGQVLATSKQYADRVVPINFIDYDHYIRVRQSEERVVKGRYVVFLDIYAAYQSDLEICGLQSIDPSRYYQSLNRFFELLELKYGVKVVIAAHPKADYRLETFHGREIYQGLTPELVKDADFVISHHSASLSYAVLNQKPLIIVYTDEMKRLWNHTVVMRLHRSIASYLDVSIYNIDEITQGDQIAIKEVNPKRYENYKYGFLTTQESEHITTQEIFWREINASQKNSSTHHL